MARKPRIQYHGAIYHIMSRGDRKEDIYLEQELLERMSTSLKRNHTATERWESAEARAQKLLNDELKRPRWDSSDLQARRKADPEKIKIAKRLRQETTVTWAWIAQKLVMGAKEHSASQVRKST